MDKNKFSTQVFFKIMFPIVIAWGIITIWKAGYATGVWLYTMTH